MSQLLISQSTVNIVESFVARPQKRKGAGSGESKLYLGPRRSENGQNFMTFSSSKSIRANNKEYNACSSKCCFDKKNLIDYMKDAKKEYFNPNRDTIGNLTELYNEYLDEIKTLSNNPAFIVHDQTGIQDPSRLYIGCVSPFWALMRKISIPNQTQLTIKKLMDKESGDYTYLFTLHFLDYIVKGGFTYEEFNVLEKKDNELDKRIKEELEAIKSDITLNDTQKAQLVLARKGQGQFRNNVLKLMPSCPFTGLSKPELLIASHCIPWKDCTTAADRLDPLNGLALSPTYDALFDKGFISFNDNGTLLISKLLSPDERIALNIEEGESILKLKDRARSRFLAYHRQHVFRN